MKKIQVENLEDAPNLIIKNCGKMAIMNAQVGVTLQDSPYYAATPLLNTSDDTFNKPYLFGKFLHTMLYIDPTLAWDNNVIYALNTLEEYNFKNNMLI